MKKRVLAVLLAVMMIASSCVFLASASVKAGQYLLIPAADYETNATVQQATELSAKPSVTAKTTPSMPATNESGTIQITNSNYSDLVSVTPAGYTVALDFSGTLVKSSDKEASGTLRYALKNGYKLFKTDVEVDDTDVLKTLVANGKITDVSDSTGGTVLLPTVKLINKLYAVKTGVHFSGKNTENLVYSEIAVVEADVYRKSTGRTTTMVVDLINDLMLGDTVTLKTSLKGSAGEYVPGNTQDEFYKFSCWVDGSGEVISYSPTLTFEVTGNHEAYAVYIEIVDRVRVSFETKGNGTVAVDTDEISEREVFSGKKQVSVLKGKDITFNLTPDEGWQVGSVIVTDSTGTSRNITSLVGLLTGETNWKALIRATLTNTIGTTDKGGTIKAESLGTPTYTFSKIDQDYFIKVTFIEQAPMEAGEGKELPTIAAEGLTLMSAEEAVSEAEAAKAANGEGTTVPGENGVAGAGGASGSVVNPATGSSGSSVAVFAALSAAAAGAFVALKKKKED